MEVEQDLGKDKLCGLFGYGDSLTTKIEIPLRKISYCISLCEGIAQIDQVQTYHNPTNKFLEVQFRFPIHPSACLHKFIATFGVKRIQGVIQEKQIAIENYKTAVKNGRMAAYGEINEQSRDIMSVMIGNISPGEEVMIEVSHIEELKLSLNTFYRFDLITQMFPRYTNNIPKFDMLRSFRNTTMTAKGIFEWDFILNVKSSRKIEAFKSITHSLTLQSKNDACTYLSLTMNEDTLDRDFSFIYSTENFQIPSFVAGKNDSNTTVMVSFIPKFCTMALNDAVNAAAKNENMEVNIDHVQSEYVFLLDRSGSMEGYRIQSAKKTLVLFLKSLPANSYFNVISFGSSKQYMFKQSQKLANDIVELAIQRIQRMTANLGGTEISELLQKVLMDKIIEGYSRQVFLLTDGQVTCPQKVIQLVRKNIKYSRIHTIGIGEGVCRRLIEGCAENGKGSYVFINDHENPAKKVIQLLNDSLSPVITNVQLNFDQNLVESIVPNPVSIPYILKGDIVNFFVTFKGHLQQQTVISLSYTDPCNNIPYNATASIDPRGQFMPFIDKMAHFRLIKALEESESENKILEDKLYYVKSINKKRQIVDLSLKHQILSKFTAFLCVQKELVDGRYEEVKGKGKVQLNLQLDTKYQQLQREVRQASRFSPSWCAAASSNLSSYRSGSYRGYGKGGKGVGGKGKVGTKRTAQKRHARISILGITKSDIRRLARRGGVIRISSFVYDDARQALQNFLHRVVGNSIVICEYSRRVTVSALDVIYSLKLLSRPLYQNEHASTSPSYYPKPTKPLKRKLIQKDNRKQHIPATAVAIPATSVAIPAQAMAIQQNKQQNMQEQSQLKIMDIMPEFGFVQNVAIAQRMEGYWDNIQIIQKIFDKQIAEKAKLSSHSSLVCTILIFQWLKKYNCPEYSLIIKKAQKWLEKQENYEEQSKKFLNCIQ